MGGGKIGEGDSEVQTSSYKPLWVCSYCLLFFLDFDHVVLSPQVFYFRFSNINMKNYKNN